MIALLVNRLVNTIQNIFQQTFSFFSFFLPLLFCFVLTVVLNWHSIGILNSILSFVKSNSNKAIGYQYLYTVYQPELEIDN